MPEPLSQKALPLKCEAVGTIARFGPFELNLTTAELRRQGRVVNMRQQSMRILVHLVEHAGTAVTREELQAIVWPSGTYIEFESGLYTAVNQMRQALGESASKPYFIETVPKVGYRFISPIQLDSGPCQEVDPEMTPPPKTSTPTALVRKTAVWIRPWAAIAIIIATAGSWVLWNRARSVPPVLDHLRPFTTARGNQDRPSFSPDGEMLAYLNSSHDSPSNIYVQRLDAATPLRLSKGQGNERRPVWSPDGRRVAFLRDGGPDTLVIMSVRVIGQEERKWAEFRKGATPWFDWSPDGKWFSVAEPIGPGRGPAVVLISPTTGERHALTSPPQGWRGDSLPVFSPDSTHVAFRRTMAESSVEDIYEVPLSGGTPQRLTFDNRMIRSFCFTPSGGIVFDSKRNSSLSTLWWLNLHDGRLRSLTAPTTEATSPAISRDGKHLAFSKIVSDVNIWRINVDGSDQPTLVIDSQLSDTGAQFSPEDSRIAFASNRLGNDDVWVSDTQGNNAVRLTDGRGAQLGNPKWSPDGRRLAFEWQPAGRSEIYVIAAEGGVPRKLVADGYQNSMPSWSGDGRFIYFASTRSGQRAVWKVAAEGGDAIPVSRQSGFNPLESPDGQYLYYFRNGSQGEVWRVPIRDSLPTGPESRIVGGLRSGDWGNWVPGQDGIYYIPDPGKGDATVRYFRFEDGSSRTVFELRKPPVYGGAGLALSHDGKTLLFAQIDQDKSNIFVQ